MPLGSARYLLSVQAVKLGFLRADVNPDEEIVASVFRWLRCWLPRLQGLFRWLEAGFLL